MNDKVSDLFGDKQVFSLSEEEKVLIKTLREEAHHVKDCFTKFSFQAIVFASLALGVLSNVKLDVLAISIICISVVFILLTVARIGTYKYGTANRNYGYELHLFRSKYTISTSEKGWQPYMRNISWEEALRAWRIVQATVFEHIYYKSKWSPNYLRMSIRKKDRKLRWFQPGVLVEKGTKYYSGSYLETMLIILNFLAFLSITPILIIIIKHTELNSVIPKWQYSYSISIYILLLIYIIFRVLVNSARRKVLEGGLLSIHSCSIMWQAVIIAHFHALEKTRSGKTGYSYQNYTFFLSQEAKDLKENVFNIHDWINGTI